MNEEKHVSSFQGMLAKQWIENLSYRYNEKACITRFDANIGDTEGLNFKNNSKWYSLISQGLDFSNDDVLQEFFRHIFKLVQLDETTFCIVANLLDVPTANFSSTTLSIIANEMLYCSKESISITQEDDNRTGKYTREVLINEIDELYVNWLPKPFRSKIDGLYFKKTIKEELKNNCKLYNYYLVLQNEAEGKGGDHKLNLTKDLAKLAEFRSFLCLEKYTLPCSLIMTCKVLAKCIMPEYYSDLLPNSQASDFLNLPIETLNYIIFIYYDLKQTQNFLVNMYKANAQLSQIEAEEKKGTEQGRG